MKPMTRRERKIVAAGLLVAVIGGAWLGAVQPIAGGFVSRERERETLIATYQRNQRLLSGIPAWSADAAAMRRTDARYAIAAPSQALAAEVLRERVGRVLAAQGGGVKTVQSQEAEARPGWVRVRADAALTTEQLHEALRRLQLEEPYVVVEHLAVSADRAFETGRAAPADVRLEVSARHRPAKAA